MDLAHRYVNNRHAGTRAGHFETVLGLVREALSYEHLPLPVDPTKGNLLASQIRNHLILEKQNNPGKTLTNQSSAGV
jgi:hypothetical protein